MYKNEGIFLGVTKGTLPWDTQRPITLRGSKERIIRHTRRLREEDVGVVLSSSLGRVERYDVGRVLVADRHEDGSWVDCVVERV